jgi:mannose-6-phosphate isomerase-like protein (cupin superfamily)
MKGYVDDIEDLTESNKDFRRVLYTGRHLQLVLMALKPGEDIGEEVHADRDQFFRVEKGKGEVWIDGQRTRIESGDAIVVPAGAKHNVINTGEKSLKLYAACPSVAAKPAPAAEVPARIRPTHPFAERKLDWRQCSMALMAPP